MAANAGVGGEKHRVVVGDGLRHDDAVEWVPGPIERQSFQGNRRKREATQPYAETGMQSSVQENEENGSKKTGQENEENGSRRKREKTGQPELRDFSVA